MFSDRVIRFFYTKTFLKTHRTWQGQKGVLVTRTSSQAKGTNSTSFLTHKVELVPLACEDVTRNDAVFGLGLRMH